MKIVTSEEMRKIDRTAIDTFGIPEMVLMENAGRAIVDFLKEKVENLVQKKVVIVCGTGNNGGDGYVVARYLQEMGVSVKTFRLTGKEMSYSTAQNYQIFLHVGGNVYDLDSENTLHLLRVAVNYCDIFVDAMFGTGLSREVEGMAGQVIDVVNHRKCLKVAVDIPSGLDANTGMVLGKCLHADYTVTMALPKYGLFFNKGIKNCGKIIIKDIGIPKSVYQEVKPIGELLDNAVLAPITKERSRTSHKGSYGHLLIIGGSMGMSGAVTLASQAAIRSGVGLVSCVVPQDIQQHVAMLVPEAMVIPANGDYQFRENSESVILERLQGKRAVVIGPGMGTAKPAGALVKMVLQKSKSPVVIDADGLNTFEEWKDVLSECSVPVILTPHPGEMARLTGKDIATVQNNRLETARLFAEKYHVTLILKGANTIIATQEGAIRLNQVDSPALAVGGSGDVLSGMIGALLAQGFTPEIACSVAVYLHGSAGVLVEEKIGSFSSKAGDIIEMIPTAIKQYAE